MRLRSLVTAVLTALAVGLTGCSTGHDAVAQGGSFEFVAPGGRTDIFYDPPADRHRPGLPGIDPDQSPCAVGRQLTVCLARRSKLGDNRSAARI